METIHALIKRYGLEEDLEHVIIPLSDRNGRIKKCYLLKRRFMRLVYTEGHYVDYPLAEVIEAIVRYPELLLSEALYLLYKELEKEPPKNSDGEEVQ